MRVSVILPVHNGMPYVTESIQSLLSQTLTDFELVIGDDASSDGTGEVVADFARQDCRIRHLRRSRRSGLASSANWLVQEARAPLVAIAHADDLSKPTRLERLTAALDADRELQLVGSLSDGVDERGQEVRPSEPWRLQRPSPFAPFAHSSVMMRKSAFYAVGGYRHEAEYWEDLDLYLRVSRIGRIGTVPANLSSVRHSSISTRLRDDPAHVENAVDLMYRAVSLFSQGDDYDAVVTAGDRLNPSRKVHPRTFVACSWTRVCFAKRPGVMWRMIARSDFRLASSALLAFLFVGWATISPRSLRTVIRWVSAWKNRRTLVPANDHYVEWQPCTQPRSTTLVLKACEKRPGGCRPFLERLYAFVP